VWYQEPESVGNDLKALARKLFVPQANRLGWDFGAKPNHADALLRSVCTTVLMRKSCVRRLVFTIEWLAPFSVATTDCFSW